MSISSPQVSVKFCQEGTDSLLSDMAPTELIAYGRRMTFTAPENFVKVAYPVDRTFFWVDRAQHEAEVSKLKASGKPVVVDEVPQRGHPDANEMIRESHKIIIFGNE